MKTKSEADRRDGSRIVTGCCGFRMSRAAYGERFSAVEVQQTFYQPPRIGTLEGWRRDLPAPFEFTLKAWQLITHESHSPTYRRLKRTLTDTELGEAGAFRSTPIVREAWEITAACAAALEARHILFQCPASFTPTEEHVESMREFFTGIDRGGFILLWEPRGGWSEELIRSLATELDLVHVVDPFTATTVTPEMPYYRLHGRTGYGYIYEDEELRELLTMLPDDHRSYVFFNNVRMLDDATRFQEMIRTERRGNR